MSDKITQRSFIGGELAPALRSRADIEKYQTGLALCENFIVRPQGGIYNRPGTKYVDEIKNSAARGRLIPFQFNTDQSYLLLFENNVIRVFRDGGYVLSGGVPYEVTTTYTTAEIPRLIFTQDADLMTITHPEHNPARLSRVADDNWTLADIDYTSSVDTPTGLAVVATGTASGLANKTYEYVVTAVIDGVESLPTAGVSHSVNALTTTYGSRVTWNAVTDAEYYRVYRDPSVGTDVFAWVGDTVNLTFDDFNVAPDTSDAPPSDYLPFAATDDKPATVGYFQQREVFGNSNNKPQDIFMTQTANYESMRSSRPARTDDAIFFTIKSRQINEIRHIVGLDALIFLTSGAEWRMTEGQNRILTPSTIGLRTQSYWGCSWCKPVVVGDSVLFVQEKGTKVRDISAEFVDDKYRGADLSILAEHLFEGYEIDEMGYAQEPFSVVWCVRNDGGLLGMTYHKEQGVWAWHQHSSAGGEFESVAVISEDGRDAVYFIVKRTIDGSTVRYVERLQPRYVDTVENGWYSDCALQYSGAAALVITGLGHLEGESVVALADGNVVEGLTVTGGEVTLPAAAEKVTVGLAYTAAAELLEFDTGQSSTRAQKGSISSVYLDVFKSRGGWVGTVNDDDTVNTLYEIKARQTSDNYDTIALRSFKQSVTVPGIWERGIRTRIEQRAPLPLAILGVTPDVEYSS